MPIRAFVFDAYGTLYDVQSVLDRVEAAYPGRGALITQIWRLKQLEYTWLRTCMDAFADFAVVTRDSLAYALRVSGIEPTDLLMAQLEDAYLHLTPAPEAREGLTALKGRTRAGHPGERRCCHARSAGPQLRVRDHAGARAERGGCAGLQAQPEGLRACRTDDRRSAG